LNIIQPIGVLQDTQMDLGDIVASAGDDCTMTTGGARSGDACFGTSAGTLGVLDVTGTQGSLFTITLGGSTAVDNANGLSFTPTLLDNGEGAIDLTGVTLQAGHELTLGGTLVVDNATLAATFTATDVDYDVTVAYP
jgi:hypothetical protein